jgi:ABC-2 type transport system permease protein
MSLWRLEWLRLTRTRRWIALGGVYLFFGLLGPITARYLPDILARFGGDIQVTVPDPVPADGVAQFVASAAQIGLLVLVVVAAAALALDAIPEMGVFLRTRVVGVRRLLLPRFVTVAVAAVAAFVIGVAAAWYETVVLIGGLPVGGMLAGTAYGALFIVFAVAVAGAASGVTRSVLPAVMVSLGALLALPILSLYAPLQRWLPSYLVSALEGLVRTEGAAEYLPAAAVTVALSALLWVVTVRTLARREA